MNISYKALAALLLATSTSIFASDNTYEKILHNGLKVIVREDHRSPIVVSQVWYKVGGSYEDNGITGISHMLEHMMFKATKNLKDQEFNQIIAENGGNQNAFTSNDYTGYYQVLQKDKLELSMRLESDRMHNLLFDNDIFQKERQVVAEERRLRTDDVPTSAMYERFNAAAYITNPYHNPVVGWMDDIQNYDIEDLKSWYTKWYAPNNAILVVVGDVEYHKVFSMAENYFGKIAKQPIKVTKPRKSTTTLGRRDIKVELPSKVPMIMMGFNVPSIKTTNNKKEIYAMEVISVILSGGSSSRFSKDLVRDKQIATSVSAYFDAFSLHDNLFTIVAAPQDNTKLDQLEKSIIEELEKLKNSAPTKEELELIKSRIYSSKIYKRDSIQTQASEIGSLETIGLPWNMMDEYDRMILKVSAEDIMNTAKKYFVDKNLVTARLIPQEIK